MCETKHGDSYVYYIVTIGCHIIQGDNYDLYLTVTPPPPNHNLQYAYY